MGATSDETGRAVFRGSRKSVSPYDTEAGTCSDADGVRESEHRAGPAYRRDHSESAEMRDRRSDGLEEAAVEAPGLVGQGGEVGVVGHVDQRAPLLGGELEEEVPIRGTSWISAHRSSIRRVL